MDAMVKIGRVGKAHGLLGELKTFVEDAYWEDFLSAEIIFLEIRGQHLPYFVEDVRAGNAILVKLEDVNSRDDAQLLHHKDIYLRREDILPNEARTIVIEPGYERFTSYTIEDATHGLVGKIDEVIEMPQQMMAVVVYRNREILIPLNEQFIVKADEKESVLHMDLPDGLLDL
ncbi:MAG: ribosome maturation factor RimM [Saprospiraceae bacterium]|nr:ribosome maturation factor RimM [Saprospiraceae bacterium]MDZ4706740.1 ribosome maturation factor RimM [Saprospiraceae bacterium]